MNQEQIPVYPVDKDTYGKSAWQILHTAVAQMPEIPSKSDKIQFRQFLARMLHYYPCDDCKTHAHDYIKVKPPKMNTKFDLQHWLCDYHNDRRKEAGKPTIPCDTMISNSVIARKGAECVSCNVVNHKKSQDDEKAPNKPDLPGIGQKSRISVGEPVSSIPSTHFADLRNISQKILSSLLERHGIPSPEVYHESCPGKTDTSCTHFPVSQTNELVKTAPVRVYFDPNVTSARAIAHEAVHIIKKYRGLEHWNKTINEQEVEKEARELIEKEFPKAATKPIDPIAKVQVEYDKKGKTKTKKSQTVSSLDDRAQRRLSEYKKNLPTFAHYFKESAAPPAKPNQPFGLSLPNLSKLGFGAMEQSGGEGMVGGGQPPVLITAAEPAGQIPGDPAQEQGGSQFSEGVLSMLDPVYRPFADMLGVLPRHVNEAHTPEILGQIVVAGAESNLNLFGSLMVSVLGATTTLLAGTMAREQLGIGDRKLLIQLGAHLLWNPLTYITHKGYRAEVIENARDFGSALRQFNVADITDSLLPPEKQKKVQMLKMAKAAEIVAKKKGRFEGDTGSTGNTMKGAAPKAFKLPSLSPGTTGPGSQLGGRTYEVDTRTGRGIDGGRVATETDVLEEGESMIDFDPFAPAIA